jgi:transcriptional regulator with XRE-family HTH domain
MKGVVLMSTAIMTKASLQEFKDKFEENFKLSKKNNKNFGRMFQTILEEKNITKEDFIQEVGLSGKTFDRYLNNIGDPSLKSIITFAVAFKLDMLNVITLLRAGGYGIDFTDRTQYAYSYLITDCFGMSVTECNKILRELGIAEKDLLNDTWGV